MRSLLKNGAGWVFIGFLVKVIFDQELSGYHWTTAGALMLIFLGLSVLAEIFKKKHLKSYPKSVVLNPNRGSISVLQRGAVFMVIGLTTFLVFTFGSITNQYVLEKLVSVDGVYSIAVVEEKVAVNFPVRYGNSKSPLDEEFVVLGFDLEGRHITRSIKSIQLKGSTKIGSKERIRHMKCCPRFFVVD